LVADNLQIIVTWETLPCRTKALKLAEKLGLPLAALQGMDDSIEYSLHVTEHRLELIHQRTRLFTEFLTGPLGYRRRLGGGKNQAIARAIGLKTYPKPLQVLDVTAGLGKDGFILACLGCHLQLIERSPLIAELLLDGLKRAGQEPAVASIIHSMQVTIMDAKQFLQTLSLKAMPDIIYLDPMFPSRTKNALSKIEMRMIRDIVGQDEDADELLLLALKKAKRRVVVKRPNNSPSLSSLAVSFVVEGRSNRYDVYLANQNIER
jgi:16S rRNA (guanine1516-N2)-methyltransferase